MIQNKITITTILACNYKRSNQTITMLWYKCMYRQGVLVMMLTCNHTSTQGVIRHENRTFTA